MTEVQILASEADVIAKLDTEAVAQALPSTELVILFPCTNDDRWQDKKWKSKKDGKTCILIKLPYEQVKEMEKEQVAELMLQKAQERLRQAA